jgi:superoxide dismutase, Cu-Zn family
MRSAVELRELSDEKTSWFALLAILMISFNSASTEAGEAIVDISAISVDGIVKNLGTVALKDTEAGLSITTTVSGLIATKGQTEHGFHVQEKGSCLAAEKSQKLAAGEAAGPHYDPKGTKSHKGPAHGGHLGDLWRVTASDGEINSNQTVTGVTLKDFEGRALMIHEGGDTYSDQPENGGAKGRIACGVIPPHS